MLASISRSSGEKPPTASSAASASAISSRMVPCGFSPTATLRRSSQLSWPRSCGSAALLLSGSALGSPLESGVSVVLMVRGSRLPHHALWLPA